MAAVSEGPSFQSIRPDRRTELRRDAARRVTRVAAKPATASSRSHGGVSIFGRRAEHDLRVDAERREPRRRRKTPRSQVTATSMRWQPAGLVRQSYGENALSREPPRSKRWCERRCDRYVWTRDPDSCRLRCALLTKGPRPRKRRPPSGGSRAPYGSPRATRTSMRVQPSLETV